MHDNIIMKELKQRQNNVLIILAIYTLTIFIYRDFGIPLSTGFCVLTGIVLLDIFKVKAYITSKSTSNAFFCLCILQIIEINRAILIGNIDQMLYIPVLLILSICVYTSRASYKTITATIKIWSCISFGLSCYVIIVSLFPWMYYNFVADLITGDSRQAIEKLFSEGYGIAVGGNIIIICYFVSFVILYNIDVLLIDNRKDKLKRIITIFVGIIAFLLINRKTELLALIISSIYIFSIRIGKVNVIKRTKIILSFFLITGISVIIVLIFFKKGYLNRFSDFFEKVFNVLYQSSTTDISSGRFFLWSLAIEIFFDNPIIGIGWGNYRNYLPDFLMKQYNIHNAHNCVLQVLCETGIIGFVCFFGLLGFIFYRLQKNSSVLLRTNKIKLLTINDACIGYHLFFFITMLLDPTIYSLIFWCLYSITLIISNNCIRAEYSCSENTIMTGIDISEVN